MTISFGNIDIKDKGNSYVVEVDCLSSFDISVNQDDLYRDRLPL